MTIQFEEFIYANETDQNSNNFRRQLKEEEVSGLLIELVIEESKNGLDADVIEFKYDFVEFSDQTAELQLEFECPECISSFEIDIMTIIGLNGDKVLFEYDVDLPP